MSETAVVTLTVEEHCRRLEALDGDALIAVQRAFGLMAAGETLAELARRGRAQAIAEAHDTLRMPYHAVAAELGVSKPLIQQQVYLGREPWLAPDRPATEMAAAFDAAAATNHPVTWARRYQDLAAAVVDLRARLAETRAKVVHRAVLLGHSQQTIADQVGVSKTLIGHIDMAGRKLLR